MVAELQNERAPAGQELPHASFTVALVGNPNTGKTTLFNKLTGLRAQTANYPGTTVERRTGRMDAGESGIKVLDLPGVYSLRAATPEERVACDALLGQLHGQEKPDAVVAIVDAANLERNLFLVSQLLELNLPVVVALNMMDVAERHGKHIDAATLSREIGCPVIPMVARSGRGLQELRSELGRLARREFEFDVPLLPPEVCGACTGCPFQSRFSWAEATAGRCLRSRTVARSPLTERIDRFLTHPVIGVLAFVSVTLAVFYLIFNVAALPMQMIDALFAHVGSFVESRLPAGDLRSLVVDGVIGGVGGILVFLPQICILFFFLALLEDTGYLARAAFVMDRLMRRIGLPGTAFVPLLSAHACAIPAIMATRVIRDSRDRLLTILIAPLMSCSARIPVYAMVTALMFPGDAVRASLVFTAAYVVGIVAALVMAAVFRRTILPGDSRPLILELPGYKLPSLRTSLLLTLDRAKVFVSQAGTIILVISIVLWALATYPHSAPSEESARLTAQAAALESAGRPAEAAEAAQKAGNLQARHALEHSFAGRLGKLIEPAVTPLGFDWQIGIGLVTSFAAREVIVSTLAIVYGIGEDSAEGNPGSLYDTLRGATRPDGSKIFTTATCGSLLVFYVLAMQCFSTLAVTRRETGSWKWPALQFAYMTALAYGASLLVYQVLSRFMAG
jgi:ferrous iron transport protein B